MSDPAEELLEAVEAALRGSAPLPAAMGLSTARIYAERPENAPMPYVLIGDDQVIGDEDDCAEASEIFVTLHVYARSDTSLSGARRVRRIGKVLRALLRDGVDIDGHETVVPEFQDSRYLTDPGGASHGVLTFRYLTTPIVTESEA